MVGMESDVCEGVAESLDVRSIALTFETTKETPPSLGCSIRDMSLIGVKDRSCPMSKEAGDLRPHSRPGCGRGGFLQHSICTFSLMHLILIH